MKTFDSLGAMAMHLMSAATSEAVALHAGLERVLVEVEKTAKAEIGTYQPAIGGFVAWEQLADSTEDRKQRMGYSADSPLLASGEMQKNITHERHGLEGAVGSPDQYALYHELGTVKMPPRPVFGPAALHRREDIQKIIGAAAVTGLLGGGSMPAVLAYDLKLS